MITRRKMLAGMLALGALSLLPNVPTPPINYAWFATAKAEDYDKVIAWAEKEPWMNIWDVISSKRRVDVTAWDARIRGEQGLVVLMVAGKNPEIWVRLKTAPIPAFLTPHTYLEYREPDQRENYLAQFMKVSYSF